MNRLTTFAPQVFRAILLRRLHLPLCATAGLANRSTFVATTAQLVHVRECWAAEGGHWRTVVSRICREAGGWVTTNVLVRDLDLVGPDVEDNRRLEVVADGLPLFGGAQLAMNTTVVSAFAC